MNRDIQISINLLRIRSTSNFCNVTIARLGINIQEFDSVEDGIKKLADKGYLAVEVHSTRMIADRNLGGESKTVCYENRERCGLRSSTWKPTWICYDNEPLEHPGAVGPTGCDKEEILSNVLNYNESKAKELINSGVVGQDYWVDCKN